MISLICGIKETKQETRQYQVMTFGFRFKNSKGKRGGEEKKQKKM